MIKAIVVDDEKLVRKGFISLIDWASFGIVIVGEAADGKSALELLDRQEADLLFTDITMPGLSGFDLIKQVRFRFPHVHSVVLTCHHEFDYVQEALRLGAIDYIVKTLLEMDNLDGVMNRIVERIRYEDCTRSRAGDPQGGRERLSDRVLALVPAGGDQQPRPELPRLPLLQRQPLIELEGGLRVVPLPRSISLAELQRELDGTYSGKWLAALVTDLGDNPAPEAEKQLAARMPRHLFYSLSRSDAIVTVSFPELAPVSENGQRQIDEAFAQWSELKWALYNYDWDDFARRMTQLRPDPQRIHDFAVTLLRDWSSLLQCPQETALLTADTANAFVWGIWKIWFRRFADLIQRRMIGLSLSKEVMFSLIRAILFMRAHAGEKINQSDVAAYINMSRSYFSQCFAKFAGLPFGEALRELRIELAKSQLLGSEAPIYEVASSAGFEDEKYFSRVFRERVGLLPTEFRAEGRKSV